MVRRSESSAASSSAGRGCPATASPPATAASRCSASRWSPPLIDGCSIIVNHASRRREGGIYVVRTSDGLIVITARRQGGGRGAACFVSDNPDKRAWPTLPWPDDGAVLDEVRWTALHGRFCEGEESMERIPYGASRAQGRAVGSLRSRSSRKGSPVPAPSSTRKPSGRGHAAASTGRSPKRPARPDGRCSPLPDQALVRGRAAPCRNGRGGHPGPLRTHAGPRRP